MSGGPGAPGEAEPADRLGALPEQHAVALAVLGALFAVGAGVVIRSHCSSPRRPCTCACRSFDPFKLKHVPVVEMLIVASGFVLRVLGGAAATHVKPSVWFLLVCSLGALGVTVAKRYTELTSLGADAVKHRPVMRWYRPEMLRIAQVTIGLGMLATYLMWALSETQCRQAVAHGVRTAACRGARPVRRATARRRRAPGGRPDTSRGTRSCCAARRRGLSGPAFARASY